MMAHKSEIAFKSCKGLSFINWEDLNEEEYRKLDKIINSNSCSAVQLPFSTDDERHYELVPPEITTVYQPVLQPPAMSGYSFPFHWTHGDPTVCSPAGAHYAIAVQGGYACPNPALTGNRDTTMSFVPAGNTVQPAYAVPGHHFQPHYQTLGLPQSEPVDLSLPATRPPAEVFDQHVSPHENFVPAATLSHPVTMAHTAQGDTRLSPDISHMVSVCHQVIQQPLDPQNVYISQANSAPPPLIGNGCESSAPESSSQSSAAVTSQSTAISGLAPAQRPSSIEFGGPVVFTNSPTECKQLKTVDRPGKSLIEHVVIDMEALNISDVEKGQNSVSQDTEHFQPQVEVVNSSLVISGDAVSSTPSTTKHNVQEQVNSTSNQSITSETVTVQSSAPPLKMWSSLFGSKSSSPVVTGAVPTSPLVASRPSEVVTPVVPNAVSTEEAKSVRYWQEQEKAEAKQTFVPPDKIFPVGIQNDPLAPKILELLNKLQVSHTPIVIQPRGLVNGSNTCFMNATLQVLMGCPPFVRMFQGFKDLPTRPSSSSSTPIFDSLIQFVNSFQNGQRIRNQGSRNKKNTCVDINVGQPFSPTPLLSVAQDILGLHIGVQHDAEEFLSRILMICHEELENVMKLSRGSGLNNNDGEHKRNGFPEATLKEVDEGGDFGDDDGDESWLKVGPKNHHVETNVNDCGQTPLSHIFAGLSRSCLVRESGKTSDTVDSFFTLKLDIQAECVRSVTDAILRLNTTETVHDADGGKVQGQRRMFFDVLPPVLIMHLKLFQYSNGNGQKIQKKIDFDVDLIIPKETLSRVGKTKLASLKSRTYKLFGVVNHHGMKMNNGHYTSDVYLPVANGWLHFDDSEVTHIHESQVLQYSERRMPYLLFYRRMDL